MLRWMSPEKQFSVRPQVHKEELCKLPYEVLRISLYPDLATYNC